MPSEMPFVIRWVKYLRMPADHRVSLLAKAINGSRLLCSQRLARIIHEN
jgi:hypothetical protein